MHQNKNLKNLNVNLEHTHTICTHLTWVIRDCHLMFVRLCFFRRRVSVYFTIETTSHWWKEGDFFRYRTWAQKNTFLVDGFSEFSTENIFICHLSWEKNSNEQIKTRRQMNRTPHQWNNGWKEHIKKIHILFKLILSKLPEAM